MERTTTTLQIIRNTIDLTVILALSAVLLMCPTWPLHANLSGRELAMKLVPNVVQIRAKWSGRAQAGGFGLIVGERGGLLHIVTANHVVRGNSPGEIDPTPAVIFPRMQGAQYPSRLLETSSQSTDLAVVTIEISRMPEGISWIRGALSATAAVVTMPVWFIGLERDWRVPTRPGVVSRVTETRRNEYSGTTIVVGDLHVSGGTSGAPLISEDGIVGMIVSDSSTGEVEAIPIERIEAQVREWKKPWELDVIPPQQDCDRWASSPYDINRPEGAAAIELENIDVEKAMSACYMPALKYRNKIPRFAFQMGRAAQAARNLVIAEVSYSAAAERGYAAAQSGLGSLYELQNREQEAADLYRKAADQGDPIGQTSLATMLRDGVGGQPKDDLGAVGLYKDAVRRSYPPALSGLAWMYEQGRGGLALSEPQAIRLYREAATKGDPYAVRALRRLGF